MQEQLKQMLSRSLFAGALLAAALLSACAVPIVPVMVTPDEVALVQGDSISVLVTSGEPDCPSANEGPLCQDIDGLLLDYTVVGAPPGMGVTVGTDLQSPDTEGLIRLTVTVAPEVAANQYELAVHAMLNGAPVGRGILSVHVLPAAPESIGDIVNIAAGERASFAILEDGTALSWGVDGIIRPGDDRDGIRALPAPIPGLSGIVDLDYSDSRGAAVLDDGTLWLWGENRDGLLFNDPEPANVPLPRVKPELSNVTAVALGARHVLALAADGVVYAWGYNYSGQLGDGTRGTRDYHRIPQPVPGLPPVRDIAASDRFSLALDSDGTLWSWGNNEHGLLGRGQPYADQEDDPTPSPLVGLGRVQAISVEGGFVLALLEDGTVAAWGENTSGQLGDGTREDRASPVAVQGLDNVTAIAAGNGHALALRENGEVWGWGSNFVGQLRLPPRSLPAPIPHLEDIVAIAAGSGHSLALARCGQVWGQGANEHGELGMGFHTGSGPGVVAGTGGLAGECVEVPLRVAIAGAVAGGALVSSADVSLNCYGEQSSCVVYEPVVVPSSAPITLIAEPGSGTAFSRWSGSCQGQDPILEPSFDAPATCIAEFENIDPVPSLLGVTAFNGHVSSSAANAALGPPAIDCGDTCNAVFAGGSPVSLQATPNPGYAFTGWSGDCSGTDPTTSLLMDGSKHCIAGFRAYDLSLTLVGEGSVVSTPAGIDCPDTTCAAAPGVGQVTLDAAPGLGWLFAGWSGDCAGADPQQQVTMDADRACTATFERNPSTRVLRVLVTHSTNTLPGTVQSTPPGIDACGDDCRALFPTGSTVDLLATPQPGSEVANWFGDCTAPGSPGNSIVMNEDKTCSVFFADINDAEFPVALYTYIPSFPSVGQVVQFDATASYVFDPDTLIADPQRIVSIEWDFENDGVIDLAGSRGEVAVVQHAFQAEGTFSVQLRVTGGTNGPNGTPGEAFERFDIPVGPAQGQLWPLGLTKTGNGAGQVASVPAGLLECDVDCQAAGPLLLQADTVVTLRAAAAPGSTFTGWSGANCGTGTARDLQVTMTGAANCVATFEDTFAALAVTVNGNGSVTGPDISCGTDCTASILRGSTITLRAQPAGGQRLDSFSGCDVVTGNDCILNMNTDRNVTANFVAEPIDLQVENSGGGRVTSTPAGIDCGSACVASFPGGSIVELAAVPDAGFQFVSWSLDCTGGGATVPLIMNAPKTCRANFAPLPTGFTLTLQLTPGTPGNIVAVEPAGTLDCTDPVCTYDYPEDTLVRLQSVPVLGTAFLGWTAGDCDAVVNGDCEITMTGNRTVRALFE